MVLCSAPRVPLLYVALLPVGSATLQRPMLLEPVAARSCLSSGGAVDTFKAAASPLLAAAPLVLLWRWLLCLYSAAPSALLLLCLPRSRSHRPPFFKTAAPPTLLLCFGDGCSASALRRPLLSSAFASLPGSAFALLRLCSAVGPAAWRGLGAMGFGRLGGALCWCD